METTHHVWVRVPKRVMWRCLNCGVRLVSRAKPRPSVYVTGCDQYMMSGDKHGQYYPPQTMIPADCGLVQVRKIMGE